MRMKCVGKSEGEVIVELMAENERLKYDIEILTKNMKCLHEQFLKLEEKVVKIEKSL